MRDAAVGFHCPTCVAEGAKSTRSGRTAYGGLRPGNAGITSMVLIGINAAVWLLVLATGGAASQLLNRLMLLPTGRCVAGSRPELYFPSVHNEAVCTASPARDWIAGVSDGAYWQLLTSAFTHVEIWHIGFNMLALWVLGPQLEIAIGRARFVALYLLSGLAGSVLVYWAAAENGATLGASGLNHLVKILVARPRPPMNLVHVEHRVLVLACDEFLGFLDRRHARSGARSTRRGRR